MSNKIYSDNVNRAETENNEGLVSSSGPRCDGADLSHQSSYSTDFETECQNWNFLETS